MQLTAVARFDEKKIDALFAAVTHCHLPGVAVGIAIDGVPVYRKGFGLANMELPIMLSPAIRMRIGSTTKHFTALAYLLLCEDGLCGLDDEIGKHLPELHEASRHVTVRQLLGHTSGIRDIYAITWFAHGAGPPVTDREMIDCYRTIDDSDFEPGTAWSYNNGGYLLVSAAIERIAGESLDEVLRRRIFEPVGLYDTLLRRWHTDFVVNTATLHMVDRDGHHIREYLGTELSGAGGIISTADDMLRWMKHMDSPVVGSAETWRLMREPQRLANGISTGYGLGLESGDYRGVGVLGHSGSVMGGNAQMIRVPAARLDISIATNADNLSSVDLANRVIDACVEGLEPTPKPVPPSPQARCGLFVSKASGRVLQLSVKGDSHLMSIDAAPPTPVQEDSGVLRLAPSASFFKQSVVLASGALTFMDFGNEDVMDEIAPEPGAAIGPFAGRYRADSIGVTLEIAEALDGAHVTSSGRHGVAEYRLTPLASRLWRAESDGPAPWLTATLTFGPDGRSVLLTASRVSRLRFKRLIGEK